MLIIKHEEPILDLLRQREELLKNPSAYKTELDYLNNLLVARIATEAKNQSLL